MERELATKAPRTQGGAESHSGQRAGVAPFALQMQATVAGKIWSFIRTTTTGVCERSRSCAATATRRLGAGGITRKGTLQRKELKARIKLLRQQLQGFHMITSQP